MLDFLVIMGITLVVGIILFFIPKTDVQLIQKLEKEGYRHIVITKSISIYKREVNVNHINLSRRAKISVWYSLGGIEIDVIQML